MSKEKSHFIFQSGFLKKIYDRYSREKKQKTHHVCFYQLTLAVSAIYFQALAVAILGGYRMQLFWGGGNNRKIDSARKSRNLVLTLDGIYKSSFCRYPLADIQRICSSRLAYFVNKTSITITDTSGGKIR